MQQQRIAIRNRFRIDGRLNQGAFGVIYKGADLQTGNKVAIKFESTFAAQPQLSYEYKLYTFFAANLSDDELAGIPRVYWFGIEGSFYCLVMDLLGFSLEDLFVMCNRRFSLKTTLQLADQMISRLQFIHSRFYLHRDIKPDNFVVGIGTKQNTIHLIDLGLSKRYRDPITKQHVPYSENCQLTGTIRYLSKATHIGIEQSRRDDLESLGYVLVYFLRGSLPWQGLPAAGDKQRQDLIFQTKMQTPLDDLCAQLPIEFQVYFEYLKGLGFYDKPDYAYLRNLFRNLMVKFDYKFDNQYDWTELLDLAGLHGLPGAHGSDQVSTENGATEDDVQGGEGRAEVSGSEGLSTKTVYQDQTVDGQGDEDGASLTPEQLDQLTGMIQHPTTEDQQQ